MLSETAVFPLLAMVTTVVAACCESTSPKLTLGGVITTGTTARVDVAVLPLPPFPEVTFPVVLVKVPFVVAPTVTLKVQLLFAAIVAPERVIVFPPLVVRVPPQTALVPLATVRVLGRTSVKPTPVSATGLTAGLVMVKPNEVVSVCAIEFGLNALAMEGGATTTMLADAVPPLM
jgi:hypothetical protein